MLGKRKTFVANDEDSNDAETVVHNLRQRKSVRFGKLQIPDATSCVNLPQPPTSENQSYIFPSTMQTLAAGDLLKVC